MFTGLIQHLGKVVSVGTGKNGTNRIVIESAAIAGELHAGDSVSVSGVCLTALDITNSTFAADLAAETVARTSLTKLKPGAVVNLETAVKAGTPLGGHIVQGHVDATGEILTLEQVPHEADFVFTVKVPQALTRYIVSKGSICIEGISLTVAILEGENLTTAIIPHTYQATNLHTLKYGDLVNIEVDVLAKYAEKQKQSSLTVDELMAQGF